MDHLALVSNEGFSKLSKLTERLTELSIDGTKAITENGLAAVLRKATSLKKLKFAALHKIHGILADISSYECRNSLEELYIGWTIDTTYRKSEVIYQLGAFPNLKKLTVPGEYPMDDNSVAHVLKNCPRLEEAEFFDSKNISEGTKQMLQNQLKSVSFKMNLKHTDVLPSSGILHANEFIQSVNGFYTLKMLPDGVLALLDRTDEVIWKASVPFKGRGPWRTIMQDDGNIVIYASDNTVTWASNTSKGRGEYKLVIQDDRNLVLYRTNGGAIWDTTTVFLS